MSTRTVETFESWESYVECARDALKQANANRLSGVQDYASGWAGGVSFSEACDLAAIGWSEPRRTVDAFVEHVESMVDLDTFQTTFATRFDVSGAEVDMGRFLSGEPECMIESEPLRIARKGRSVRLVVPFGYRGGVEPEQAIARGAAIVALADLLAKAQHPVEIIATRSQAFHGRRSATSENGASYHCNIVVQRAEDPLDIDRLLYVFAHPSAYRRIGFATLRDDRFPRCGYGNQGGQVQPVVEDLGEHVENTHVFPHLEAHQDWSEDGAKRWIEAQLAEILD